MIPPVNHSERTLNVRPMNTLTEEDGMVFIITKTQIEPIMYVAHLGYFGHDSYFDYLDRGIRGTYRETLMGWMPVPFVAADAEKAFEANKNLNLKGQPNLPVLEGDLIEHLTIVQEKILGRDPTTPARTILAELYRQLGDDVNGPIMPASAPLTLKNVRKEITYWVQDKSTDSGAIEAIYEVLTHYHPAFPKDYVLAS
jgi:hypothetical protein